MVNNRTGMDRLVAAFASSGRKFAAIPGTNGTKRQATNAPAAPANTLTSKLSKTNNRIMLAREAPIATRSAISRRRPLNRTRSRFATLLQAMRRTKLTAANKVMNPARIFWVRNERGR